MAWKARRAKLST